DYRRRRLALFPRDALPPFAAGLFAPFAAALFSPVVSAFFAVRLPAPRFASVFFDAAFLRAVGFRRPLPLPTGPPPAFLLADFPTPDLLTLALFDAAAFFARALFARVPTTAPAAAPAAGAGASTPRS